MQMAGYPPPQAPGFASDNAAGYGPRGPSDDHLWAMLSYLLTFVGGVLAPIIIYAVKLNESRYVRFHAAQSLNMALTAMIYTLGGFLVGLILALVTHGFALYLIIPAFVAYAIAHLVYLILAAVASNRGEYYEVPTVIALPLVH
jgi:uncharacterized Tic20 family protein